MFKPNLLSLRFPLDELDHLRYVATYWYRNHLDYPYHKPPPVLHSYASKICWALVLTEIEENYKFPHQARSPNWCGEQRRSLGAAKHATPMGRYQQTTNNKQLQWEGINNKHPGSLQSLSFPQSPQFTIFTLFSQILVRLTSSTHIGDYPVPTSTDGHVVQVVVVAYYWPRGNRPDQVIPSEQKKWYRNLFFSSTPK